MVDWSEVREDIKEDFEKVNTRLTELEHHTIQYKILFEEHAKQDAKMYDVLADIKDEQVETNRRLDVYNQELHVHIAGVQELKDMNKKLVSLIDIHKKDADDRFDVLEAPYKWIKGTKDVVWYLWTVGASLAGAYAFYAQFFKK